MALATCKALCIDAGDAAKLARFWAGVLDLSVRDHDDGDADLSGATPEHTIWVNRVPEAKTVKHRVHWDIYTTNLAELETLGAQRVPDGEFPKWTVLSDPEGGEFCAFLVDELPADRLHGLVVDSVDPHAQAAWWGEVYGATVVHDERGF